MRQPIISLATCASLFGVTFLLPGCQTTNSAQTNGSGNTISMQYGTGGSTALNPTHGISTYATPHVTSATTHLGQSLASTVKVYGISKEQGGLVKLTVGSANPGATGQDILDLETTDGLLNYLTYAYPKSQVQVVQLVNDKGQLLKTYRLSASNTVSQSVNASAATFALGTKMHVPPPGTSIDHRIHPLATIYASNTQKADAVIREAEKKIGTKYIWGHNEDRGQYGFDCSNYVAYVYHHALGYRMSGSSRYQAKHVGVNVPIWDKKKGDLLIFEHGRHVGIYMGNDKMIQCGGGLGKVGELSLGRYSYWGKHITAVKRMF